MTPAAARHLELETTLAKVRKLEDAILEEMGDVWWLMTTAERAGADERAKKEGER